MVTKRFRFKELIPLFNLLPEEIFKNLDLSGFFLPTGEIEKLRKELEDKLNNYVVSYKAGVFNLDIKAYEHLCAIVKGADLTKEQMDILKEYEQLAKPFNVTFVVYKKPLELMELKNSALYKEYLKRGLL